MTSVCNKPLLDVTACGNTFWLVIYVSFIQGGIYRRRYRFKLISLIDF